MKQKISLSLNLFPCVLGLLASVSTQVAVAQQSNIIRVGEAANISYLVSREGVAENCELYVEEFGNVLQDYRGASSNSLNVTLRTRLSDKVLNVGGLAIVEENSVEGAGSESEKRFNGERSILFVDEFLAAYPQRFSGNAELSLDLEWNSFARDLGSRKVKQLSFFVDLADGSSVRRVWLKNGTQGFTAEDFSKEKYSYSVPVTYGYGSISYLSQNSGSPLFKARNRCSSN